MSIKSLLQLILLLLIIVILGGIYSLYFYKGPLKNKEVLNSTLIEIDNSNKNLNSSTNDEILEEIDASIMRAVFSFIKDCAAKLSDTLITFICVT